MKRRWFTAAIGLGIATLALASGALACDDNGGGAKRTPARTPAAGATVEVNLTEWIVSPDPESVAAGSVTFTARNIGGEPHELVIVKTDLPPEGLPTADDGSVDEAGEGIEVIDEIEEFDAGTEESLAVDLDAGAYVLLCNVVEEHEGETTSHYAEGMHAPFTVE